MSTIKWLNHLPDDGVYLLRDAQNSLLQVLLTEFYLARDGHGFTLNVSFKESDTAIRRRKAKDYVRDCMPGHPSKVDEVQAQINAVFSGDKSGCLYADPDFAFRYASGGTLPIVEYNSTQYYCLFYRDEFPVGWNIANGACDSLSELLNPKLTIERELREELIILDLHPHQPLDYKFTWPGEVPVDAIEFGDAKKLANCFLAGGLDICKFDRPELKVDWGSPGPDTLQVKFERDDGTVSTFVQQGYYLNITAKDFGIELDCIARIQIPSGVSLLDGEINRNKLLNRPIGLFEVRKTQEAVGPFEVKPQEAVKHSTEFLPDHLFHSTRKIIRFPSSPEEFEKEIIEGEFIRYLRTVGLRNEEHRKKREEVPLSERFDLCPITRSIIQRHMRTTSPRVFISYSRIDRSFAEQLEQDLTSKNIKVWRDAKGVGRADRIDVPIEQALKDCSYVLLLVSQHSRNSEFVCKEVQYACNVQKPGIAVMLEHCQPPFVATLWPQIDFHDRYQEALNELVHALFSRSNE